MTTTRFVDGAVASEGQAIAELQDQLIQRQQTAILTDADGGTIALTAAQVINGVLNITGGTTSAITFPAAADVLAALENGQVGSSFDFTIINGGSGTASLTAGTGNTLVATADLTTGKRASYKGVVTAVGTPAVSYVAVTGLT